MKVKYIIGILGLFLCVFSFISCDKEERTDKVETIKMYVSAETDTYIPWGSNTPVECMLVKEEGYSEYSKLAFNGIAGFTYEKKHEYTLIVEKTTLVNPPADSSNVRYRLIEIIKDNKINTTIQWISLIDDSKDNGELDISSKYMGVQGWSCIANPPYIYVGAAFPESTFNASFDKEVTNKKNPIYLTFDFNNPYITNMETVTYNGYLMKIKEAINSEEFSNYNLPTRPYQVKFAELMNPDNLNTCFVDNHELGNTLKRIVKQEFDMNKVKSLCIGKVIFKSFTVSMETPTNGLFMETPSNLEKLVYIRMLTYGTSAYFVIGSNKSYQEILAAFKKSFMDDYLNPEGSLKGSQIILLTTSDINQEAEVKTTFNDLNIFLKNPFMNGKTYGYPIYCKGFYVKDNSLFVKD